MFRKRKWAKKFNSVVVTCSGTGDSRGAHGNNFLTFFSLGEAAGPSTHQKVREHVYSGGKNWLQQRKSRCHGMVFFIRVSGDTGGWWQKTGVFNGFIPDFKEKANDLKDWVSFYPIAKTGRVEGTTCAKDTETGCFLYQGYRDSGGKQVEGAEPGQVTKALGRLTLSFGKTGRCSISRMDWRWAISVFKKIILEIDTKGSRKRWRGRQRLDIIRRWNWRGSNQFSAVRRKTPCWLDWGMRRRWINYKKTADRAGYDEFDTCPI